MSVFFNNYMSRNEISFSLDSPSTVIEVGHTSSLLRPFTTDISWNKIMIWCRMAISGSSPTLTNITRSNFFFGVCSGNKRFSQTDGSTLNTHAIGVSLSTTTASTNFGQTTNAKTDPTNQVNYSTITIRPVIMSGSNIKGTGLTVGSIYMKRIETQWSSSLDHYNELGNTFIPFALSIEKASNGAWTIESHTWNCAVSTGGQITSSMNIPNNVFRMHDFMEGESSIYNHRMMEKPILVEYGTSATQIGLSVTNTSTFAAGSVDTNTYGEFDTLDIYWRCDPFPDSKILIKDLRIYRIA